MAVAQDLLTQALQLPANERADMARQLLLSLEPDTPDEDYESAWEKEILERVKEYDEGKVVAVDWREAHEEIRKKLQARKP
jgi:putative addiction module component (TIGR02574 family)